MKKKKEIEDFPEKIFVAVTDDGIFASETPEDTFDLVDDTFHLPVNIMEYHRISKPVKVTRKFELS